MGERMTLKTSCILSAALALVMAAPANMAVAQASTSEEARSALPAPSRGRGRKVTFRSMDEPRTELVGFLYTPRIPVEGKAPAVVLMHGRGGAYSNTADGVYESRTLTLRHRFWAEYWAERGYYALVVDSFGPRGFPTGFAAGTYSERPATINEVTIRPLDAYGALRFLRTQEGVDSDRIGLMGWSNGGSATLSTMADDKPGDMSRIGFRAAIAMYPGCGLQNRFRQGYQSYAPLEIHMGTADEEVSHDRCRDFARGANRERNGKQGAPVVFESYAGASHSFDDPGTRRQSVPANARATRMVRERLATFFETALAPR